MQAKYLITNHGFLDTIRNFDKDNIDPRVVSLSRRDHSTIANIQQMVGWQWLGLTTGPNTVNRPIGHAL